jgi:hypothetical protein
MKHIVFLSFFPALKAGEGMMGWFSYASRNSVVEFGGFMHDILSSKPA